LEKIPFSDVVGIAGIALATVLLVLDKAGKLKGGWLLGLLCLAGVMTLFIALGNSWIMDSPLKWRLWRGTLIVCCVGLVYSGLAIWISESEEKIEGAESGVDPNKRPVPVMEPWIYVSDVEYPSGTTLGGIRWSNRFTELRVSFNNESSTDYHDLDFTLVPDQPIAEIGQITNLPEVSFSAAADPVLRQELVQGATGRRIANPLILIASSGGYRVRCQLLPRKARLEILIAIARVTDFPKPGQKVAVPSAGVFDKTYALKVDQNDGVSHWYGHGMTANGGRIEEVFKPDRIIPKTVKIEGHYMVDTVEQEVSRQIEVKDIVGDALKKINH
jgi:hypothetical protein